MLKTISHGMTGRSGAAPSPENACSPSAEALERGQEPAAAPARQRGTVHCAGAIPR